jgi:hypothetical protein
MSRIDGGYDLAIRKINVIERPVFIVFKMRYVGRILDAFKRLLICLIATLEGNG